MTSITLAHVSFHSMIKCKNLFYIKAEQFINIIIIYGPILSSFICVPHPFYTQIGVEKVFIHAHIGFFWPIRQLFPQVTLTQQLLLRRFQSNWVGYRKFFFLKGMGFKMIRRTQSLLFKIGLANKPFLFFNINYFRLYSRKFNKFVALGISYESLIIFIKKIHSYKIPDIYRGKGFFYKGQYLKLKRGKRRR